MPWIALGSALTTSQTKSLFSPLLHAAVCNLGKAWSGLRFGLSLELRALEGFLVQFFFPHITMWGSFFSLCTRRSAVFRRDSAVLRLLRRRLLHHSSYTYTNSSYTTHLTPPSCTTHLTPTHLTPLIYLTPTHHTPLILHHSSYSTHLTSHTTHLTPLIVHQLILHHSSYSAHLTTI